MMTGVMEEKPECSILEHLQDPYHSSYSLVQKKAVQPLMVLWLKDLAWPRQQMNYPKTLWAICYYQIPLHPVSHDLIAL